MATFYGLDYAVNGEGYGKDWTIDEAMGVDLVRSEKNKADRIKQWNRDQERGS